LPASAVSLDCGQEGRRNYDRQKSADHASKPAIDAVRWQRVGYGSRADAGCTRTGANQSQPAASSAGGGSKPNILVIFGDDIGQSNISAYTFGLMGY
jgi:hypothetical protein